MRILIITYSREVNPGTFLQAYGVQYVFKQLYPDAKIDLIRHRRMYSVSKESKQSSTGRGRLAYIKAKVRAVPRRLKYEIGYKTKFHLTEKEFDFFDYDDEEFKAFAESYDLVIVGSDTILINLERNGHYGLMWLMNIDTDKILFAASAAPVNFDLTERQRNDLKKSFESFKLLGVRDRVTQKLITEQIGLSAKVYSQYDPTYLIPDSEYSLPLHIRIKLRRISKKQKIALVNFGIVGCPFKKEITIFLKRQGFYTISTLYNDDADYNLMALSPFEWAALFKYVDLTVTERFHDSVFTLRNGNPVVAIDWNKHRFSAEGFSKTQDLLSSYGLDSNHFIAQTLDEAKLVMEYIKTMDPIAQKKMIKQYNLEIIDSYNMIMQNVKDSLNTCGVDKF